MSFLKPNKAEIDKYKQKIKDYKAAKVTAPDSLKEYKQAWGELTDIVPTLAPSDKGKPRDKSETKAGLASPGAKLKAEQARREGKRT